MQGREHRLPTIEEVIEKAKRGIIDESMAAALLAELEQSEPHEKLGAAESTDQPSRASA